MHRQTITCSPVPGSLVRAASLAKLAPPPPALVKLSKHAVERFQERIDHSGCPEDGLRQLVEVALRKSGRVSLLPMHEVARIYAVQDVVVVLSEGYETVITVFREHSWPQRRRWHPDRLRASEGVAA
jgi:hypothetical protein